jgi:O-methyltransferase involved in polyketide biosynthesis
VEIVGSAWDGLAPFVRTGTPVVRLDQRSAASQAYPVVAAALGEVPDPVLDATLDRIGDPGTRLLDLGAGVAPFSRALCRRHPGLEAVAVDLPEIAAVARRTVEAEQLADRLQVVAGDLFRVDLGTGFDTVLVSGVCRLFGEMQVRRLLERAAAATAPGGQIVVIDALPDDDRRDGGSVGIYALGLALRTGAGGVHGFADYAAWLFGAGFVRIEAEPLGPPEQVLVRARRPG